MNKFNKSSRCLTWFVAALVAALAAGCGGGGGRDPILGIGNNIAGLAPTVTSVIPAIDATGVAVSNPIISATFNEAMAPISGAATFAVTCAAPCTSPTGTVALDATNKIATFTLAPSTSLLTGTLYTGTITGATSLANGLAMATPYVWHFTTAGVPDLTRPRVTVTVPATTIPGPTAGAFTNTAISAKFSEDMAAASISATSFKLTCAAPCVSPTGAVSYAAASRTAVFTPAAVLAVGATYTATITTAATDIAGNALAGNQAALPAASNYVWTFTTAAAAPVGNVSVLSTNPAANAANVCTDATVNATFSVPSGLEMDPLTVTSTTFKVTGPAPGLTPVTAKSVVLDNGTGRIATFTPLAALTAGVTYTATIKSGATGVKDLAVPANTMLSDFTWVFTASACAVPPSSSLIDLGAASTFGIMSTSAITSTGPTQINGDVGLSPGTSQGIPAAQVNGVIHVNDAAAAAAKASLPAAYNQAKALAPGVGPNALSGGANLSGLTLPPGTYTSGTTILISGPAPVVLDGGGNTSATWVFQMGSSLTTVTGSVSLIGGAQAKNVFWVPTADATIGSNTIFYGSILAGRDVTAATGATINGRILAGAIGAATVALDSNTVNVP